MARHYTFKIHQIPSRPDKPKLLFSPNPRPPSPSPSSPISETLTLAPDRAQRLKPYIAMDTGAFDPLPAWTVPQSNSDQRESPWFRPWKTPWNRRPGRVAAGLLNLGNTCFLNAVLQCITHTVPLVEKILSAEHSCANSGDCNVFCLFCELRKHLKESMLMSGLTVAPARLAANLSKISSFLKLGDQEDAHEFLNSLLDQLHTCCLDLSSKDKPSSYTEDTLVTKVFGGRLRSQLRCCACGHCSDTFEPLLDISLEIEDVDCLDDALKSFTRVEKIEDPEVKFTCEGCKVQVSMEKQLKVDRAPTVIALHLKRFKNNGIIAEKKIDFVKYPMELNLSTYLSCQDNEESTYELYAFIVHEGSTDDGHYFSFVRSSPLKWYRMDDSKVVRVSEDLTLRQDAYILFYIKKGSSSSFASYMESLKIPYVNHSFDESPISVLSSTCMRDVDASSSSSSEHTPDRDPSSLIDASPQSVKAVSERDHGASPYTDISPYFVKAALDRDHAAIDCRDASPEPVDVEASRDNGASPSRAGDGIEKIAASEPPAEIARNNTSYDEIDRYIDDPMEDGKEDDLIPEKSLGSKVCKEPEQPGLDFVKAPCLSGSVEKLMRGMPKTRRSGLLSCLASDDGRPSFIQKSHQASKRQKISDSSRNPFCRPVSTSKSVPKSRPVINASTIRGLFTDNSTSEYEFRDN